MSTGGRRRDGVLKHHSRAGALVAQAYGKIVVQRMKSGQHAAAAKRCLEMFERVPNYVDDVDKRRFNRILKQMEKAGKKHDYEPVNAPSPPLHSLIHRISRFRLGPRRRTKADRRRATGHCLQDCRFRERPGGLAEAVLWHLLRFQSFWGPVLRGEAPVAAGEPPGEVVSLRERWAPVRAGGLAFAAGLTEAGLEARVAVPGEAEQPRVRRVLSQFVQHEGQHRSELAARWPPISTEPRMRLMVASALRVA